MLRNLGEGDIDARYLSWLQDEEVGRYLELRLERHDLVQVTEYVRQMNESDQNLFLGIFEKKNNVHIGNLKIGPINFFHKRAEIGLLIGEKSCWGKGLASEAIRRACMYAFDNLGLKKVFAGYYSGNNRSGRSFEKVGFKKEGRLRSHWKNIDGEREDQILIGCFAEELK